MFLPLPHQSWVNQTDCSGETFYKTISKEGRKHLVQYKVPYEEQLHASQDIHEVCIYIYILYNIVTLYYVLEIQNIVGFHSIKVYDIL